MEKDKEVKRKMDLNNDEDEYSTESEEFENETQTNDNEHCSKRKCYECLSCAFPLIYELSLSGLFTNLYIVYKFALTLPSTQVTCERVFSKLKIIKNRLRSSINEELLSDLLLMNIERDIFADLDKYLVIDKVGTTSEELKKKLLI